MKRKTKKNKTNKKTNKKTYNNSKTVRTAELIVIVTHL